MLLRSRFWGYERIHTLDFRQKLIDEFTFDRFKKIKNAFEYLYAEAAYLHYLHDDMIEGQAHDAWASVFPVYWNNGEVCAGFWPAFRCHLEHIDWGIFRHQNEEFLSQRYGYEKLDVEDLVSIASCSKRRQSPCSSLMLWTALAPMALNAKDNGLASNILYKRWLKERRTFFSLDDVLTSCAEPKMESHRDIMWVHSGVEF